MTSESLFAAPDLQLPWPTGDAHGINGGNTYGCPDYHVGSSYYAIDFQLSFDEVAATAPGVIEVAEVSGDIRGSYIQIDHGGGFKSRYLHLDSWPSWVQEGAVVGRGYQIATSGNSGGVPAHLHFDIKEGGAAYRPEPMSGIPGPGEHGFGWYGYSAENVQGCGYSPNDPSPLWTSTRPFSGYDTSHVWRDGRWYLRNVQDGGPSGPGWPDCAFVYGVATDTPLMGDWDGDGVDTVGVWRNAQWLLRNSNTGGSATVPSFNYGTGSDTPVVGDWDGNGTDNAGIVRAAGGTLEWHLRFVHEGGGADITFAYGPAGARPVAGDWNRDGIDTIGYAENHPDGIHLRWHFRNSVALCSVSRAGVRR